MKLSSGTFLSDKFISNIVFLSLVHRYENLLDKNNDNEWCFTMGYMNNAGELKAFELRFDDLNEAKQARKEVAEEIMKYE